MKSKIFFASTASLFLSFCTTYHVNVIPSEPSNFQKQEIQDSEPKWGEILPNKYANCVSKKNSNGQPIVVSKQTMIQKSAYPDGYVEAVECEKDPKGFLSGTSADGKKIDVSDAIQACLNLQQTLPSQNDYQSIKSSRVFPNVSDNIFWTSTVHSNPSGNLGVVYKGNYGDAWGGEARNRLFYVRCIGPKK